MQMDKLYLIGIGISIGFILTSLVIVFLYRHQTKRLLTKLHGLLDAAIRGEFEETTYDESSLSSLEIKLSRFLKISLLNEHALSKEKDKIKSLISDISHQTKTPISNILLYLQLLREEPLSKECEEMLHMITLQSEKLDFLIQTLIKSSRLETGIISVCCKPHSILELITNACSKVALKAQQKNIQLHMLTTDCVALFDKKWTEEALYNILDNAIKYTPCGGKIVVSSTVYEMFCRIDISDTGMGIKEQDLNAIFKRFYRSEEAHAYEGVGIGLFLAREIISLQGGYIKVASTLSKGSTFSMFLPL